jgi:16S rRNA (guanine(966)-N(2))-methyltransferase RsmD
MRIVAGRLKGRRLRGPTGAGLRPTSDGLRETLFNVLGNRVEGARVLDGFAGTGAVGLEALSRGALRVTFVENDRRAVAVIRDNIIKCGAASQCDVVFADMMRIAERDPGLGRFGLVFLDPPYDADDLEHIVVEAGRWMTPDGTLVVEHSKRRVLPERAGSLVRYRILQAGDSALSFYAAGSPADTMNAQIDD